MGRVRRASQDRDAPLCLGLLAALLGRRVADVVHLHVHNRFTSSAAMVCRFRRIPYLISIHSRYEPIGYTGWFGMSFLSYEYALAGAAGIIAVSGREQRKLQQLYPGSKGRIHFAPNGVNLNHFAPGEGKRLRGEFGIHASAAILLQVGSIYSVKNQLYSIHLLAACLEEGLDVCVVFVGPTLDNAYMENLLSETERTCIADRVAFCGQFDHDSEELLDAYRSASVLLLPSLDEACPMTALEGLACGVPILANRIDNLEDFGIGSETGEWCDVGASAAEAVMAVRRLLAEGSERSQACRRMAENYSWTENAMKLEAIYRSALNG